MNKFDFIIFEHTGLQNHLIDLYAIGRLIKDAGFKVAIANVTREADFCPYTDISILKLNVRQEAFKNKSSYMKAVIDELSPLTKNFYVGSILSTTSLRWLKYIPPHLNVFLWALRSFFFTSYKRFYISRSYLEDVIRSIGNTWITKRKKNIYFLISDSIIRDEFIALGYDSKHLIVRPERTTTTYNPVKDRNNSPLSILAIGTLRPEKRLDLCIDALETIGDLSLHLTIAGRAYTIHGYDKMLEQRSFQNPYITRITHRLSSKEYNTLITNCDYLILCDESQPSSVTNGTMSEALLAGRPIIAPNYNPYKFVIKKYGVGILYDISNRESLIQALLKAKNAVPSDFADGIMEYQKDFMYNKVLSDFAHELKNI